MKKDEKISNLKLFDGHSTTPKKEALLTFVLTKKEWKMGVFIDCFSHTQPPQKKKLLLPLLHDKRDKNETKSKPLTDGFKLRKAMQYYSFKGNIFLKM